MTKIGNKSGHITTDFIEAERTRREYKNLYADKLGNLDEGNTFLDD